VARVCADIRASGLVPLRHVPLFVYRNAFEYLRYGYASAATLLMLVLTAAIVIAQLALLRRYRLGTG